MNGRCCRRPSFGPAGGSDSTDSPGCAIFQRTLGVGVFLSVVHAVLCALAALFQGWVTQTEVVFDLELSRLLANRFNFNLAVYFVIVGAWHAWDYYRKFKERDAQAVELAARLAEAQLQSLRMQLNPHFLFNTLNSVSSLMLSDVFAANKMISGLAGLLRLGLENTERQEVPLRQEIDFLQRYLDIQKIRFGDRLHLKVELDPATLDADVPSLILQPIVENAVRHAIELRETAGQIELRSLRENGSLILSVSDNGPGLDLVAGNRLDGNDDTRNGVGLGNTRERLRTLYGERQRLQLNTNELGGMTATLSIPFHQTSGHSAVA